MRSIKKTLLVFVYICKNCLAPNDNALSNVINKYYAKNEIDKQEQRYLTSQRAQDVVSPSSQQNEIFNKDLVKDVSFKIIKPEEINIKQEDLAFDNEIFEYISEITESLKNTLQGISKSKPPIHLFGGPPGTGKTTLFKILARNLGIPLITFNSARAFGKISEICAEASLHAPCLVLFDEIDTLAKSRSLGGAVEPVTEILQLTNDINDENTRILQKMKPSDHELAKITILGAATNCIEQLDDAVLSRSTYKYIGNPGAKALAKLWAKKLSDVVTKNLIGVNEETATLLKTKGIINRITLKDNHSLIKILTKKTNNYSPRELTSIVEHFEQTSLNSSKKNVFYKDLVSVRPEELYFKYFDRLIIAILKKKRDIIVQPMKGFATLLFPFDEEIKNLDVNVFDWTLGKNVNEAINKFIVDIKKALKNYAEDGTINNVNRAMLLDGPPGTGKTILAKSLAKKFDLKILCINSATITNQFVGSGPANIHAIFSAAKNLAPCVIFFDEIDNITPNRATLPESQATKADVVTALLAEMNENDNKLNPANPLIILGATNLASSMDPAITRRFKPNLEIFYPNTLGRIAIFESAASAKDIAWQDGVLNRLKEEFAKYVLVKEVVEKKDEIGNRQKISFWRRPNNNDLFTMAREAVKLALSSGRELKYDFIIRALNSTATLGYTYKKEDFDRKNNDLPPGYEHYRAFEDEEKTTASSNNLILEKYKPKIDQQTKESRTTKIRTKLQQTQLSLNTENESATKRIIDLICEEEEIPSEKFDVFLNKLFQSKDFIRLLRKFFSDDMNEKQFIGAKYFQIRATILPKTPKR